jgi:hypothetical protein
MAKRPVRSQADDSPTDLPARPRARHSRGTPAPEQAGRQAARGAVEQPRPIELDPDQADLVGTSALESASRSWQPSEDDIRLRAYHRYLERGGGNGMAFDDWLEAERELKLRG